MSSNQSSDNEAWARLKKLQAFTVSSKTESGHDGTNESNKPTVKEDTSYKIQTATSSSSTKCNDLSKIMSIQNQMASLRLNQETQTDDFDFNVNDKSKFCRNCCFGSLKEKPVKPSQSGQRGTSDEQLKEWVFDQALMDLQVSYI